jgi:hypothetical protein
VSCQATVDKGSLKTHLVSCCLAILQHGGEELARLFNGSNTSRWGAPGDCDAIPSGGKEKRLNGGVEPSTMSELAKPGASEEAPDLVLLFRSMVPSVWISGVARMREGGGGGVTTVLGITLSVSVDDGATSRGVLPGAGVPVTCRLISGCSSGGGDKKG